MDAAKGRMRTKRDVVVEASERLNCESVGAQELEEIQRIVRVRFGENGVESPASIARTLAEEGVVLRHPEVLEYDAAWREDNLRKANLPNDLNFSALKEVSHSIKELDQQRKKLDQAANNSGSRRLLEAMQEVREDLLLLGRSEVVDERRRVEAGEIAEWLRVWLSSPELFDDWLELRQHSADYRKKFITEKAG
jgi:hypothetical protein